MKWIVLPEDLFVEMDKKKKDKDKEKKKGKKKRKWKPCFVKSCHCHMGGCYNK